MEQDFLSFSTSKQPSKPFLKFNKKTMIVAAAIIVLLVLLGFSMDSNANDQAEKLFSTAKDFANQEDYSQALSKLDEAISIKKKSNYYYLQYQILMAEQKFYEAEQSIRNTVAYDSNNPTYLYILGSYLFDQGENIKETLEVLKRLTEIEPKNSDAKLKYAYALSANNQLNEAALVLEQILKDDPNYEVVYNDLAVMYKQVNQPEKALALRESSVKRYPDSAYHWFWLAKTYEDTKNKTKAVEAYKKSILLDPETGATAAYRLAKVTGTKIIEQYREQIEDAVPAFFDANSHAYVKMKINGHKGLFLVDTGATDSFLYKRFLKKYNLEIQGSQLIAHYETGNGLISVPVFYSDIEIGRFKLNNSRIGILEDGTANDTRIDGIIGMGVLKNFNVKLDSRKMRMTLSTK